MERIFTQAAGRYRAGDTLDRPEWWWRTWPTLRAASRPLREVLDIVVAHGGDPSGALAAPAPEATAARGGRRRAA